MGKVATDATLEKIENRLSDIVLALASSGGLNPKSWNDVRRLVALDLHRKLPVGDAFSVSRETALTASVGDSTGITGVSIDEDTFLAAVGEAHEGVYEATFDGAAWHKEDGVPILLADYGITVTGTPAANDHVIVSETAATLCFEIADHDKNCGEGERSLVLLSRDLVNYGAIPFDAPELLYYTSNGLAAGTYKFTLNHGAYDGSAGQDGTYVFTLTQAIPAGGGFRHSTVGVRQSSYTKQQITAGEITTYGAQPGRAVIESQIAVSEWSSEVATDLGQFAAKDAQYATDVTAHNFTARSAYGSNRYSTSAIRQWLNSDGKAVTGTDTAVSHWWAPQTVFDMPPDGAKFAGFLHGLDPSLRSVLGTATIVCAMPAPDRSAGLSSSETLHDLVFLPSLTEIYGSNNAGTAEGSAFSLFSGTGNAAKIKYNGNTARIWYLRSALSDYPDFLYLVDTAGAQNYNSAFYPYGHVPAIVIT